MRKVAEVKDLTVRIAGRTVVEEVSFSLAEDQVTALVGESGSGKTLTALAMMDLLPRSAERSSGEVYLGAKDIFRLSEEEKRKLRGPRISMVFQEPFSALNPLIKIGVQIRETLDAHDFLSGRARKDHSKKLLKMVKLPGEIASSYPHELSGGMRQRVVLAIALSCEPEVLILDEPTTALDVFTQKEILDLVADLQKERNFAALFITHDFSVVNMVADDVCVMRNGRIIERGAKDDVLKDPRNEYTRHLLECVPRLGDERNRLPVRDL